MTRIFFATTAILTLSATQAMAHPGHLGELAGHDHWVAGIAIGAAVGIGLWGALKERRKRGKKAAPGRGKSGADKGEQKPQEA